MKFASHDLPILLEVLGDLMLTNYRSDAKQLAARAYLKASYEVKDPAAKTAYRKLADRAIELQMKNGSKLTLKDLENDFAGELKDADTWYAQVRADELNWVQSGEDADQKFTAKYYEEPRVATAWDNPLMRHGWTGIAWGAAFATPIMLYLVSLWRRMRAKRKTA